MGKREILESAFEAIGRADVDALVEHYTDDYVLELPFADPAQPVVVEGRETVRAFLEEAFEVFRFTLEITATYEVPDEDMLVSEHRGEGQILTTGKPYNNTYVALWWFRGDKICRGREFVNPVVIMEAMRPD